MSTKQLVKDIIDVLQALPTEKIRELREFAFSLQRQCAGKPIDDSTEWTDEDLRDFSAAAADYANRTAEWED